jgi:hypothetical protein
MNTWILPAFSGAVAALLLRSLLKLIGKYWSSRKPIVEYDCATDVSSPEAVGIWHGRGERVADDRTQSGFAWMHSSRKIRELWHTIYGPYVNDLGRPGYMRVRFRISGAGFDESRTGVIVLDVNQILHDDPPRHITLGQRVVCARDLKREYQWFDVICYTSGVGVYEYRAHVMESVFDDKRHRLLFDVVRVFRHFPAWELL